ncbi:hypothetical protein THAOC_19826 [Thalassiosira oceanica]|uniref:Uncharacterized protein n=1 Tax=Thalassiosira oceanica TaxID=159749 RepID=K0S4W8_THAOC|nr:hypothetical protein THAOC_19826 [Thalassiosira oceanica]|eukprot:EJK59899.1 hypothetical protein THAOC_19826 [Thalassiosira oceanica]
MALGGRRVASTSPAGRGGPTRWTWLGQSSGHGTRPRHGGRASPKDESLEELDERITGSYFSSNSDGGAEVRPADVARLGEAATSRDDPARGMRCTSRVYHAGEFSSVALEGGPSARNGGCQSKEHDKASGNGDEWISTSKNWAAEPEAGGAVRRRELREETAQFFPCGAVTLAGRAVGQERKPNLPGGSRQEMEAGQRDERNPSYAYRRDASGPTTSRSDSPPRGAHASLSRPLGIAASFAARRGPTGRPGLGPRLLVAVAPYFLSVVEVRVVDVPPRVVRARAEPTPRLHLEALVSTGRVRHVSTQARAVSAAGLVLVLRLEQVTDLAPQHVLHAAALEDPPDVARHDRSPSYAPPPKQARPAGSAL